MSRTRRNLPKNSKVGLRHMAHHNYLKNEIAAAEELIDNGYHPSNRLKSARSRIVTNWDDVYISALDEHYENSNSSNDSNT